MDSVPEQILGTATVMEDGSTREGLPCVIRHADSIGLAGAWRGRGKLPNGACLETGLMQPLWPGHQGQAMSASAVPPGFERAA